jgi:hypothetical protein
VGRRCGKGRGASRGSQFFLLGRSCLPASSTAKRLRWPGYTQHFRFRIPPPGNGGGGGRPPPLPCMLHGMLWHMAYGIRHAACGPKEGGAGRSLPASRPAEALRPAAAPRAAAPGGAAVGQGERAGWWAAGATGRANCAC